MKRALLPLLVLTLVGAGCGGTPSPTNDSRLRTVHQTYSTLGMVLTGNVETRDVASGGEQAIARDLESLRCYHLLVLGSSGLDDFDVVVRDPTGIDVGRRHTSDGEAAMRVCPEQAGNHEVVVRAGGNSGSFSFSLWASPVTSCGSPLPISEADGQRRPDGTIEWTFEGSTAEAQDNLTPSCTQSFAPDQVYRVTVSEPSRLRASIQSSYDGALYLQRTCGDPQSEIACNDDAPDTAHSRVSEFVDPGEYFVVVDGYRDRSGDYQLKVEATSNAAFEAVCGGARPIQAGANAVSAGTTDTFDGTCNPNGGPEQVFQLNLANRTFVDIRREGEGAGGIYIRSSCSGEQGEVACGQNGISSTLDAGRYFLVVEGGAANIQVAASEVAAVPGGACGAGVEVQSLPMNGTVRGSTRGHASHFQASCAGNAASGDTVYHMRFNETTTLRVLLMSMFDGALHLRRACSDQSSEIVCNDDAGNTRHSMVIQTLEPGDYYLVVDGYGQNETGDYELLVATSSPRALP